MLAHLNSCKVAGDFSNQFTPAGLPRKINAGSGGYTIEFVKTPEETCSDSLEIEVVMDPKGGNDLHYHTNFEEEFVVLEGVLGLQIGRDILHLRQGEKVVAPLYKQHKFFNPGEVHPVRFRVLVKPARFFEATLRIAHGLMKDGLCNKKGIPKNIWHLALLFEMGESYVPLLPHKVQKSLCRILSGIARRLGKNKELEKYYLAPERSLSVT